MEIRNFKSFGPRSTVLDMRPGLTMIGGPNGSGKSNIGDALLFVLGTRSSKTVRADKLDDLIHTSKDGVRRSNSAYVKAVFVEDFEGDNFQKVEIARTIEENNGEIKSTYYLNDRKARHSDVEKFLDDVGIQLDSYSFVLQGDINEFITRTGNERRKLLESIGGIESYNIKIDAAKEKIGEIESNLSAARTLENEISSNTENLRKEAEKLKMRISIEEEIRNLKKTSLSIQIRSMEIDMSSYNQSLEENSAKKESFSRKTTEIDLQEKELKEKKEEIETGISIEMKNQLAEIRQKLDSLKLERARNDINASNKKNSMSERRTKIEFNSEKIEQIENELKGISENYVSQKKKEDTLKQGHSVMKAQIAQKIEIQNSISSQYQKASKELKETESELQKLTSFMASKHMEENSITGEISALTGKIGNMEETLTNEKYGISEAKWKISKIKTGDGEKNNRKETLSEEYFSSGKQIESYEKKRTELNERIEFLLKEVEKLRGQLGSQGNISRAASIIMDAKSKGNISGIHRALGDLISYDSKFQTAIDATAGARLKSIVVDNEDVAQECIELLKSKQAGRLTFLPLNKLAGGRARGKAILILNEGKSLGLVSQNVKYDAIYENAIWYAFQDTIAVDSMDVAKKYMTGVRIVTLDGDIFDAGGAITGGFTEKREKRGNPQDLIKMEDELVALRQTRQEVELTLKEIKQRRDATQSELMEMSRESSEGKGQLGELENRVAESEKKIAGITANIHTLENEKKEKELILVEIRNLISQTKNSLESLTRKKTELYERIGDNGNGENDLTEMQKELENITGELSETGKAIESISTSQNLLTARKKELIKENEDLHNEVEQFKKDIDNLLSIIREKDEEIQKHAMMENQINQKNTQIYAQIKSIEEQVTKLSMEKEKIARDVASIDTAILTARIKLQSYEEKISSLRTEMASIGGEILQDYSSVQKISLRIQELERKIGEIGPVNQLALADLEKEGQRLEELRGKIETLNGEIDSLLKLMAELEDVKKSTLMNLYMRVRDEMQKIFMRLTNGGDVNMYLSNEEDPLNSELLVKARPKGTIYSKLNSLSGGEKSLVALSFISAIQRIKPSPVYFLDEIDMFLDGVNAESMGKLLKENSLNAQIVMITQKNAITKYASSLFGVTLNRETNTTEIFSKSFDVGEGVAA